jgi:uncharacterized membrane protein YuzA (DUF378 family)
LRLSQLAKLHLRAFPANPLRGQLIVDFSTLVLILAAGLQLGLQGFFGWDAAGHLFGGHERFAFMLAGLSAVWQIFRQRLS